MFLVDPAAMEDFDGVETKDPNCVVVGLAPDSFTYDNMTKAFRYRQPSLLKMPTLQYCKPLCMVFNHRLVWEVRI